MSFPRDGRQPVTRTHSYRAALVPPGLPSEEIEAHAAAGALPTIRLRATNTRQAARAANWVTGKPVHSVERVEGGAA